MKRQMVRLELYLTTDLGKVWTESTEEDISLGQLTTDC